MMALHILAWLQMLCSLFHLDHLELFGIKQVRIGNVCMCDEFLVYAVYSKALKVRFFTQL